MATKSSKATFKHCPKLKDAYTGPSEMLAYAFTAMWGITLNCLRSQTKFKGRKLTLNQPQKGGKPLQLAFGEERGEKFGKKAPVSKLSVYLFANLFST